MEEDVPREAEIRWYSPGVIATLMGLPDLPIIGSQEFLTRKDCSDQKFRITKEPENELGRNHLLDVFGEPKFSLRKYFQHIKWFALSRFANKLKIFNPSKGSKIESGEVCCSLGTKSKTGTLTNLQNPNVVVLLESRISTSYGRGKRILLKSPTQSTNRRLASRSGFSATYNGKRDWHKPSPNVEAFDCHTESSSGNLIFDRDESSQKMSKHWKTKTNNHFEGAGNSLAEMFYLTDLEAHSVDNITRIDTRALWGSPSSISRRDSSQDSSSINQPMPSALPALSTTYASRTFSNIRQFGDEQFCTPDDGLKWRNKNFNKRGKPSTEVVNTRLVYVDADTSSKPSEKKCQRLVPNATSENVKVSCSITEPDDDDDDDDDDGGEEKRSFLEEEFRDEEERDYTYLLDMLIASGIHSAKRSDLSDACDSPEYPLKPALFARLEKKYGNLAAWSPSERKLMFDSTNMILAAMLAPCLDKHPWVKATTRIRPMWGAEGLLEKTWQLLVGKRVEANVGNSESTAMDEEWLELGDEMDGLGMVIERLVWDELLEELVAEL